MEWEFCRFDILNDLSGQGLMQDIFIQIAYTISQQKLPPIGLIELNFREKQIQVQYWI